MPEGALQFVQNKAVALWNGANSTLKKVLKCVKESILFLSIIKMSVLSLLFVFPVRIMETVFSWWETEVAVVILC